MFRFESQQYFYELITLLPGYSYLSNQHGLSLDNVVAMELVLPTGQVKTVTETSNPDLWFALRVRICTNSYPCQAEYSKLRGREAITTS